MWKAKFTRTKPRVAKDPIFQQWAVIFPRLGSSWKPQSITYFESWNDAIKFALQSVQRARAPVIPIRAKKRKRA